MKRKELLAVCERLITSFNPDKTTVDSHAEEELRHCDTADRLFLRQVFYGTFRYRELLKPLLTHFLNNNSSKVSRNDYTKFMIIAYLAMFRLDEMGLPAFSALVSALDPTSMHVFLSYFFDDVNLQGPIKSEWIRVLDQEFVQGEIIDKMVHVRGEIHALLEQLYAKAFGRAAAKESLKAAGGVAPVEKKPATVPVAPNITQPRPRKVAEPIRIPQEVKANPVPPTLNSLTLADIEKKQHERKAKIKEDITRKYEEAAKDMFQFESMAKSNLDAVREKVEAERNAQLKFDFKAKPAPDFSSKGKEIKLNTATILREDALFKKKQAKEAQLIHAYEAELRDPMDFYRWQSEMLQQDHEKWKAEVEKRRLEMVQAQYEAIEAAHRAKLENREVAIQMKGISKEMEAQRAADLQELEEKNRQQMTDIRKVRDVAPREAEERLKDEKHRQREELNEFLAAERERKSAQDAIEQAQREDLIRQIRALDRVHREHVVVFDPTETAQLGLLEEMSLAELKERLQVQKAEQQAWEESRRESIVLEKQEKGAELEDKVKTLSKLRRAAAEANASQRSRRKALEEQKKQEDEARRREGNLKLAQKLTEQRKTREAQVEKLRLEAEEIVKKRMFLGAAKNMLEENHFDQLKLGAERQARTRQTTYQITAKTEESVRDRAQTMRTDYLQSQLMTKQQEDDERSQRYERERQDGKNRERDDDELLREIARNERNRYAHAKGVLQSRNVYATVQSQQLIKQARSVRAGREAVAGAQASPTDVRASCSPEDVLWLWKGALTATSVAFKMGLRAGHGCKDRDFVLHAFPDLENDSEKPHSTLTMCLSIGDGSDEFAPVKTCALEHLAYADRKYSYVLTFVPEDKSVPNAVVQRGTFRTAPAEGAAANFRFVFSSCADEKSDPRVFHEMKHENALFLLHMGDLHYHNIEENSVEVFRSAYHSLFASPSGRAMLEMDLPFAYMWDDHDYGPDNSDKTAPGRNASVQVYREFVPHYPLPGDGPLSAVYQAFTIGRVRFILTDLRSMRTPNLAPDVPSKTVLGVKQKKWFKEELVLATQNPDIGLIVWCSTMPWHDDERKWGYFTHEQRELINYMTANGVNRWKPVVIVSGDAHMLAIDDGRYTPGNMTLFHAAALGRPGSVKGGPYSHGAMPGSGQYGVLDVRDDGKKVCLHFQGVRTGEGVLMEYDTCRPETTPSNGTFYPPPIPVRQLTRALKKAKRYIPQIVVGCGVAIGLVLLLWRLLRGRSAAKVKKNK